MTMVEESSIEMGATGNSGLNSPTTLIVPDNMPEDMVTETEEERWFYVLLFAPFNSSHNNNSGRGDALSRLRYDVECRGTAPRVT